MVERLTVQQFRRLSPEEQDKIRKEVERGSIEIVRGSSSMGIYNRDTSSGMGPRFVDVIAHLHPNSLEALIEEIRTKAESRAAASVGRGNIEQAMDLLNFLRLINDNSELRTLVMAQVRAHLPDGVKFDDLPPGEKITILHEALATLTATPKIIDTLEHMIGANAERVGEIQATVSIAEQLYKLAPQLTDATQKLALYNAALADYIIEERRSMRLTTQRIKEKMIRWGSIPAVALMGFIGGGFGGLTAGALAVPTYVGEALKSLAEKEPLPMLGGILGVAVYALANQSADVFTVDYGLKALCSFAVGAIALPTATGIVKGFLQERRRH